MISKARYLSTAAVVATLALAGCGVTDEDREAINSLDDLNVIDESNLNAIMLDFADPNQAVNYFQNALSRDPGKVEFQQGFARSLKRAGRSNEAVLAYRAMDAEGNLTDQDRLDYAEALIQSGEWEKGEAQLDAIPPTLETYDRYRLEAVVADFRKEWNKADTFYETARGLTTRPAPVYNNWGISKMSRGDRKGAEEMFIRAISFDASLFSAKNNLAISRATRKNYDLPVVPMTKQEEAQLLHNVALQAIRNGDVAIGRGLLEKAVETHPQHFEQAVAKLEALNRQVVN